MQSAEPSQWIQNAERLLNALSSVWTFLIALLGASAVAFRRYVRRKRARERAERFVAGLPLEAKAVLVQFYDQGTHTLRGNPGDPAVQLMISKGIVILGTGAGLYDAIDSYLSIDSDIWEIMQNWSAFDQAGLQAARQFAQKAR